MSLISVDSSGRYTVKESTNPFNSNNSNCGRIGFSTGKCISRQSFYQLASLSTGEMSEVIEAALKPEMRKVLGQRQDHASHSFIIPHKFLGPMGPKRRDYVVVSYHKEEGHIHVKRLEGQQPQSSEGVDGGIDNN